MPEASVDAIITDPPYGLNDLPPAAVAGAVVRWASGERDFTPSGRGFMGASWDSFVPPPSVWDECMRVLKPGAHLVAFAGARTYDLMGLSVRLAGFEIRDGLAWLYGSGMPLGQNLASKGHPGWYTTLKPAFEPMVLARKPLSDRTVAANMDRWGVGALHVDAARIPHRSASDLSESMTKNAHGRFGSKQGSNYLYGDTSMIVSRDYDGSHGRHPANAVVGHEAGCTEEECTPGCQVAVLDTQAEMRPDIGGVSRFFYTPRASAKERPTYVDAAGQTVRHNTIKPVALMRWLVRLSCPPGGHIVDPFAGSGTTVEAAVLEGFEVTAFERDERFLPLIEQRIARCSDGLVDPRDATSAA